MASTRTDTTGGDHPMRDAAQNVASASGDMARHAGELAERGMKNPSTAAAVVGVIALGAAATVGVLETVVGGGAAYIAYRALRRRRHDHAGEQAA